MGGLDELTTKLGSTTTKSSEKFESIVSAIRRQIKNTERQQKSMAKMKYRYELMRRKMVLDTFRRPSEKKIENMQYELMQLKTRMNARGYDHPRATLKRRGSNVDLKKAISNY